MERNENNSVEDDPQAGESLETVSPQVISPTNGQDSEAAPTATVSEISKPKVKKESLLTRMWHKGSIYLLAFILLFVAALITFGVIYSRNRDKAQVPQPTIKSQNLSAEALQDLANKSNLTVGDNTQVLNVQSNAVFAGSALVKGDLQIGGNIRTGGSLNLTGLSVTGPGSFQRIQAQDLAVAGPGSFSGQLSSQGNLNIAGGATFGGAISTPTLNANNLQLSGDLVLSNHVRAGGPRPSAGGGAALGSGGTTNISGSDTAGTVTINTGGGPSAGCFTTVRFAKRFNAPRVNVTPVGSGAGSLNWYVNRDSNSFSICTNSPAPASQSFAFDYFVVD